ncbi:MAG: 30S ribosomal protein S6, partial [Saprospiraceae bacterium]
MKQYEITFIIDPVLPGDEIKTAAKAYEKLLENEGCNIVHVDETGLKQLAYPINKRNSGVYRTIEFQTENGTVIPKIELAMRRDERIMRFLSVKLDKYGVKYNDDKRNGLIGKKARKADGKEGKKE